MQKITANNITRASLSGEEAAMFLPLAAQAAIKGKADIEVAKGKQASSLAITVAGFASDETATRAWTFDVIGNDGQVKYHVESVGTDDFGGTTGEWRAEPKKAQTAYKGALQSAFFNLPESNPAVWTMVSKAIPLARAIRAEGMTAHIVDGKLVLEGGTSDKAAAMREAASKHMAALIKAANGEAGTNRTAPNNAKGGEGEGEARLATPSEVMALAARLVEGAAKGEEALTGTALSFARRIAALVAANPDAFAED
jgi:hypothetical protein